MSWTALSHHETLRFTKMQGIGNDFMIVDGLTQDISMSPSQISQLASRTTGVGFDQLLVVEAPTHPSADFFYRIYNADGTAAGQCGNGARCFAKYVYDKRLNPKRSLTLQTETSRLTTKRLSANEFKVSLEAPQFDPEKIPFEPTGQSHLEGSKWAFEPPGRLPFNLGCATSVILTLLLLLPSAAPSDLSEWATALITAHSFPEALMLVYGGNERARGQAPGVRKGRGRDARLRFWRLRCCRCGPAMANPGAKR